MIVVWRVSVFCIIMMHLLLVHLLVPRTRSLEPDAAPTVHCHYVPYWGTVCRANGHTSGGRWSHKRGAPKWAVRPPLFMTNGPVYPSPVRHRIEMGGE